MRLYLFEATIAVNGETESIPVFSNDLISAVRKAIRKIDQRQDQCNIDYQNRPSNNGEGSFVSLDVYIVGEDEILNRYASDTLQEIEDAHRILMSHNDAETEK